MYFYTGSHETASAREKKLSHGSGPSSALYQDGSQQQHGQQIEQQRGWKTARAVSRTGILMSSGVFCLGTPEIVTYYSYIFSRK